MKLLLLAAVIAATTVASAADLKHGVPAAHGVSQLVMTCGHTRMLALSLADSRDSGVSLGIAQEWLAFNIAPHAKDAKMVAKAAWIDAFIQYMWSHKEVSGKAAADKLEAQCLAHDGDTDKFED